MAFGLLILEAIEIVAIIGVPQSLATSRLYVKRRELLSSLVTWVRFTAQVKFLSATDSVAVRAELFESGDHFHF